jgi:hypothetical protein
MAPRLTGAGVPQRLFIHREFPRQLICRSIGFADKNDDLLVEFCLGVPRAADISITSHASSPRRGTRRRFRGALAEPAVAPVVACSPSY